MTKSISQIPLLGNILIKRGKITSEQLTDALSFQNGEEGFLGEVLVKLGFVTERDIVVALIVQCNFPYIAIDHYEIREAVVQLIPREIAEKYSLVPLDRVGDILSVVMADPLNKPVRIELRKITRCVIAPFISTKTEIEKAIARSYAA